MLTEYLSSSMRKPFYIFWRVMTNPGRALNFVLIVAIGGEEIVSGRWRMNIMINGDSVMQPVMLSMSGRHFSRFGERLGNRRQLPTRSDRCGPCTKLAIHLSQASTQSAAVL
jgi:hypothetical protein